MSTPQWLARARRLQAIAQSGLHFSKDKFDIQRYEEVREIASELMAAGSTQYEVTRIAELFSHQAGYATPKVDVRVACFREGRILLVRELDDGCWTLPGGWADVGEAPSVAAAREALEESGYEVRITKLAAVFDRDLHGHPLIAFSSLQTIFHRRSDWRKASASMELAEQNFLLRTTCLRFPSLALCLRKLPTFSSITTIPNCRRLSIEHAIISVRPGSFRR